ncbi:uncharacterized protein [Maniola hyperantus]|uniref:uncharacterized protein isoform X2 n=1 Tax=Aphantopus hyperantus TaxID=2795564 RepID=UPI0037481587
MPCSCAFGCKRTAGVPMHRFPSQEKFPERFKTWVTLCGGKLETSADCHVYKDKRVCDIHFEAKDHNRNNRLNALAVPSLHLTDSRPEPNVCGQQEQTSASERIPVEDNTNVLIDMTILSLDREAVASIENDHAYSAFGKRKPPTVKLVQRKPAITKKMQVASTENDHGYSACGKRKPPTVKLVQRNLAITKKMLVPRMKTSKPYSKEAERKIRDLQFEILRLRRRCKFLEYKLEDATKLTDNEPQITTTNITLPPEIFTQIYVTRPGMSHRNSNVHQILT